MRTRVLAPAVFSVALWAIMGASGLFGCANPPLSIPASVVSQAASGSNSEAATPAPALPTPAPTSTATPSPTPAPTPTPLPTPKITDAWYVERTAELRKWLSQYGGYEGEALEKKVAAMEIDPDKPMVALTFDDGPMVDISDKIVDILASYDCRATFFMRGARMKFEATPDLLKKILGEGNEIGNHTWNHVLLSSANGKVMQDNITKTNQAVLDATGYVVRSLRPPGGKTSAAVARMAGRYDMAVILWAQSGNVHEEDPAKIAQNVLCQIVNGKELQNGDIILLHDTKPWMVDAVAIMVPQLLEKGYQLVTVQELLNLSPEGFVPGKTYHKQSD